jgi:hypothetical protein
MSLTTTPPGRILTDPPATLTIQLEGSLDDNGNVRLEDFLEELGAIKTALKHTELIVAGKPNTVYYRVVDLTHTSPASVRIEAVAQRKEYKHMPRRIVRRFSTSLRMIQRRHRAPRDFNLDTLEAYKNIYNPLGKKLRKVTITEDEKQKKTAINQAFDDALRRIIGPDEKERGSMMGKLEALNVHLGNRVFAIYPTVGASKVTCKFVGTDIRDKVLKSAGQYVRVDGWIVFKNKAKFPHAMEVRDIEPFGAVSKLSDIRGIAPDATKGERSEDFLRKLRDAW